ncbi:MAG: hypothetical protein Q4E05_04950 [Pseudoclavibacter sp.]|nr:hypothetical protein [Pseudoclavibacter sp.]
MPLRSRTLALAGALLLACGLSACGSPERAPAELAEAGPATAAATPPGTGMDASGAPAPSPSASETEAAPTPEPTRGRFRIDSVLSVEDCLLIGQAPGVHGRLEMTRFPNDLDGGPLHGLYATYVARSSRGFCEWSEADGGWMYAHIGTTPDGSPVDESALDVLTGSDGTFDYLEEAPYEREPYGAGTLHFAEALCVDVRCAVCHYVEGPVMVSHVRPVDGECRSTLRAIVDTLRE